MSTYKNLKIYKTHDDAARAAADQKFIEDVSKYYKQDYANCKCGQTEVVGFCIPNTKSTVFFGICSSCGEDYE